MVETLNIISIIITIIGIIITLILPLPLPQEQRLIIVTIIFIVFISIVLSNFNKEIESQKNEIVDLREKLKIYEQLIEIKADINSLKERYRDGKKR